jgi:hypothetical protein
MNESQFAQWAELSVWYGEECKRILTVLRQLDQLPDDFNIQTNRQRCLEYFDEINQKFEARKWQYLPLN